MIERFDPITLIVQNLEEAKDFLSTVEVILLLLVLTQKTKN